jgi:hypothetical protein
MSSLPKQVIQDQLEIEAYERQLEEDKKPPKAEPPAEAPVAEITPQAPASPEVPRPDNVVEFTPESKVDWEHKYRTLQGMHDKQVRTDKELAGQIQTLQAQIIELQKKPADAPVVERLVTEQDEKDFGTDLLDVQRRVAKEVMREFVAPLQAELKQRDEKIQQLEQQVQKTGGDVTTMSFEQKLFAVVPDFAAINNDPKWIKWLDEPDGYTGEPRRAFAEFVYGQGDVAKVKQVVDLFKRSNNANAQQELVDQRDQELSRQVQPTRTVSSSTPATQVKIYTEAEAKRIFEKVRQLNIAHKYDEANTLEAEVTVAYQEGRVR